MSQNLIRVIRKQRDIKLYELAESVGVTSQHMSRMERGERKVNMDQLELIAERLGVSPSDLLDRERKPVAIPFLGEGREGFVVRDGIMPEAFSFDFNPDHHIIIEMKTNSDGFHEGDHLIAKRVDDNKEALNRIAIIKITGENNPLIRRVIQGSNSDTYTLIGDKEPMLDKTIEWVAPILWKLNRV